MNFDIPKYLINSLFLLNFICLINSQIMAQKKYEDFPEFRNLSFYSYTQDDFINYRLLVPLNYDSSRSYPLVLFLHGAGERGTENIVPLTHIAPLFVQEKNRRAYPCFVLVPQCREDRRWVEVDWGADAHTIPEEPSISIKLVKELIDLHIDKNNPFNYSIDTNRIYITGLSMGGYGTWDMLARYPDMFAAAVPICGGGDEKTAAKIKDIPLWVFHGSLDKVVKPSRSRNMIKAIIEAGGEPSYTEYPRVSHGSWKPAYQEAALLPWLFSKKIH